ncbi:electron transport complex subunit RsxC [bacterium]|nr:electron transport complex subunit RsxC [bacterium]
MKSLSFTGGFHIEEYKGSTEHLATEKMGLPSKVIIPLSQHIGAPAKPVVKKDDKVKTGQIIGQMQGYVSANIHASLSGTVIEIISVLTPMGRKSSAVVIESDGQDEKFYDASENQNYKDLKKEDIIKTITDAGIVGMGGATFPTHVKLVPPKGKEIKTIIINGAECEPFLTADHRTMIEFPEEMLKGIDIIKQFTGAEKVYIGIENNKPDAINILEEKSKAYKFEVVSLQAKYPQGAEKNLIAAIMKKEVPSGGLPLDVGVVVQNVGTAKAVYDAVCLNTPLYERIVTVSGNSIHKPKNIIVRVGTEFSEIFKFCGDFSLEPAKIISGGPMMGFSIPFIENFSVTKGTSGILAFSKEFSQEKEKYPCIKCARCVDHCPMWLMPSKIEKLGNAGLFDEAEKIAALDCVECGTCAYVCPASRPLVQMIRYTKSKIIDNKNR